MSERPSIVRTSAMAGANVNNNNINNNESGSVTTSKISSLSIAPKTSNISDIRWSMLDKRRYFPLAITNMFAVRSLLYPLTLVRTRLQVQAGKSLYTGTANALHTIVRYEGFFALYKGFWINSFQLVPHVLYITSYEQTRHFLTLFTNNIYITSFVGGGAGSIIAQTLSVPIDVVSQHLMLHGQRGADTPKPQKEQFSQIPKNNPKIRDLDRIHVPDSLKHARPHRIFRYICEEIYRNERLKGFYRGYVLTTLLVSLNSSLWWPFYYFFQGHLRGLLPSDMPTLAIQCLCGPLSSLSASFITNPLDCMRTRMQVTMRKESFSTVLRDLWEQDGHRLFVRGLTARLSYSCLYSFFIILGYETVKKASLKEEYQDFFYSID